MRIRLAIAALAVFAVLATVGSYVIWRQFSDHLPPLRLPTTRACVVNGGGASASSPVTSTDPQSLALQTEQVANAATIAAVGIRRGLPHRAVVVALATAWQESKLENLSGGDRDSVGLFQQRPSQGWGRPEQIADPRYATNAFYTALLKIPGWQEMRVTDAAQAVQRSAHPEAYEKWSDESEILAKALRGDATGAVACTITDAPRSRGAVAAETLIASMRLDWGEVRTTEVADLIGLALPVRNQKAGWQYAHWLVAHAEDSGVKRVRFGDREWTAQSASWIQVTAGDGTTVEPSAPRVLAEMF